MSLYGCHCDLCMRYAPAERMRPCSRCHAPAGAACVVTYRTGHVSGLHGAHMARLRGAALAWLVLWQLCP